MNLREFSITIILGIICGIFGVIFFALSGLIFGISIGILCGLLFSQLKVYLNKSSEPQIQHTKIKEKEIKREMGLVIDFTDTRCNYCFSKENEVKYYCPKCKKSFCFECYQRKELSGLCPIDKCKLINIPENKKLILREVEKEPKLFDKRINDDNTVKSDEKLKTDKDQSIDHEKN